MSIKVINGNCLEMLDQLPEQSVNTCVTSPPYWGLRDYGESDQLGLEETPEEYVENMVAVFREVKRVLRDDGTVWLNLGDSYVSNHATGTKDSDTGWKHGEISQGYQARAGGAGGVFKTKDLVGIPWMVAFALRADGWYLRQDIIWHKPNPMPESVTDRCTKSHEYIFLLSKNKKYYYDNEVIKEDSIDPESLTGRRPRNAAQMFHHDAKNYKFSGSVNEDGSLGDVGKVYNKRNKRSVWTITTKPYKEAHFATYPPDLIEPCILAGCPEEVCVKCETPYERKVESKRLKRNELPKDDPRYRPNTYEGSYKDINGKADAGYTETKDLGLEKQCDCEFGSCPKCKKPYAVVEKKHRKEIIEYRNLPNHDELRTYLKEYRSKSGMTIDEIEQHFGTQAPHHWFEKGGSYPDKDDWTQLKELLSLDNTHDQAMTEVFEKSGYKGETEYIDKGLQKQCQCESNETKAGTVLDPFGGSGTTGLVADRNGRNAILIELNDEYAEMARDRLYNDAPLFVDIE